jgi:hypothetical protein
VEQALLMTAVLVARAGRLRIRNLVRLVVRQSKVPIPIDALFPLFSKCAANNLALEAVERAHSRRVLPVCARVVLWPERAV